MKRKIYISGKISGIEKQTAIDVFGKAEEKLLALGYEVVNPTKLKHEHDKKWSSYMRVDIKAMMECDSIYMMDGWEDSKGAKIEFRLALGLRFNILFQQ